MDTQSDSSISAETAVAEFAKILGDAPATPEAEQPAQQADEPVEAPTAEDAQATPDAEGAQENDDPTVKVKIDGKEVEVRLSELTRSYQKDAASQERFQAAAETRRAAEAELAKAREERALYGQNLDKLQAQLEGALQEQAQVNWDQLLQENPQEYLRQKALMEKRQATLFQVAAQRQQLAQKEEADRQASLQQYLEAQQQTLLAKLPEWKDESKAKAEKAALREYLVQQGYDEQSVNSVADARAVILARKAMLYDQMMSKAAVATKRVATLPTKVLQPGGGEAPNVDRRTAAYQRLGKSGRVEDAAAVFASLL